MWKFQYSIFVIYSYIVDIKEVDFFPPALPLCSYQSEAVLSYLYSKRK